MRAIKEDPPISRNTHALKVRLGWPVALVAFSTLWRLPTLGDPPWLNDEGVYAQVGKAVFSGEALYRQIWENKPPAIYLLYGAVNSILGPSHILFGVRVLALIAAIATQVAVYRLARDRAGAAVARLAALVSGLLMDLPLLDGTSANAEIFVVAMSAPAMLLLWRVVAATHDPESSSMAQSAQLRSLSLAGAAFGVAILFKLVAGMDLVAALAIVVIAAPRHRIRFALALLAGTALPMAIVLVWLASRGLVGDALYATVGYNESYVSTGQGMHTPLLSVALLAVPCLLLLLGVWIFRRAPERPGREDSGDMPARLFAAGSLWWFALALLGALASGRSYLHYYLQAVPPGAICLSLAVRHSSVTGELFTRRLSTVLLVLWSLVVPLVSWQAVGATRAGDPPAGRLYGYYGFAWQHLTGSLDDTAFGDRIDARVARNVAVARYVRDHAPAPKRLYVWGNAPWIYYLSGYTPATRFLSAFYRPAIPGGMSQVVTGLQHEPPAYIVVMQPPLPASQALTALIRARYQRTWSYRNAVLYRLRP